MDQTKTYGFNLPAYNDVTDIQKLNENFNMIDDEFVNVNDRVSKIPNDNLLSNSDFKIWHGGASYKYISETGLLNMRNGWYLYKGDTVQLKNGVRLNQNTAGTNASIRQYIRNFERLCGKTITLSANILNLKNCTTFYINGVRRSDNVADVLVTASRIVDTGIKSVTATLPEDLSQYRDLYVAVQSYNLTSLDQNETGFVDFEYIKLELGDRATPYIQKSYSEDVVGFNDGLIGSNPNLLINGDFRVAQRGTTFNLTKNAVTYTLDRWACQHMNQSVTRGSSTIDGATTYTLKSVSNGTGNGQMYIYQPIEEYAKITGKCATVSFWIRGVNGATNYLGMNLGDSDGSYGVNLTNDWQFVTKTIPVVRFTTDYVFRKGLIFFSVNASPFTSGTGFEIANVKVELGAVATPFQTKLYSEELLDCQRYYYRISTWQRQRVNTVYANSVDVYLPVSVPMRVTPTIASWHENFKKVRKLDATGGVAITDAVAYKGDYSSGFQLRLTANAHGYSDGMIEFDNTFALDAEMYS